MPGLLKRFRARRAARAEKKKEGKQKLLNKLRDQNVFRATNQYTQQISGIDLALTQSMSEDETDQSAGSMTKAELLIDSVVKTAKKELKQKQAAILELEDVISEMQINQEGLLVDKNDEILNRGIVIAFHKDILEDTTFELDRTKTELSDCQQQLAEKDEALDSVKAELSTTKQNLQKVSTKLLENEKILLEKDEEILTLSKALENGKKFAKFGVGLLTLGALCTDDR